MTALEFLDSHSHLDSSEFDGDREMVIERARAAGVKRLIVVGADSGFESARRAVALAVRYPGIFASVGLHPNDAKLPVDTSPLRDLASNAKVVAIGETGLDFYRDWAPPALQESWFRAQIELARAVKKPLIIHSRQAGNRALQILIENGAAEVGGVFHCFSESAEFAAELRAIGFMVSFPGSLTFKNAQTARDAARLIPLEQILIETDAPFLAPAPWRGRRCESAYVVETAKALAEVKSCPLERIAKETTDNAARLFKLPAATKEVQ